jgi:hypothetical protein
MWFHRRDAMQLSSMGLLTWSIATVLACGSTDPKASVPSGHGNLVSAENAADAPCQRPTVAKQSWRHTGLGTLLSGQEHARHIAQDVIVAAGTDFIILGKFSYGKTHKDLEGEDVVPFLGEHTGCNLVAGAAVRTDDDGRISMPYSKKPPGMYPFFLMVPGDGSSAEGNVYSIAPGTKAVLFDIDGTLTVDDGEMFEDLLGGKATAFPDANAVAKRWADAGYLIVYTTGRPHFLRNRTRKWLDTNGFPLGALFTVDKLSESMPTEGGVGTFKKDLLTSLIKQGLVFQRAYGNAATDACAYIRAGIAPADIYMTNNQVRECDGKQTQALPSYTEHLKSLAPPKI